MSPHATPTRPEAASAPAVAHKSRIGLLFSYDWDAMGFATHQDRYAFDEAGFDLFSFPSNARIVGFDLNRFADAQAKRGRRLGWQGVASHHEQFGALAAALVAERMGLPGTPVTAILACQHKLYARQVMREVCPEASVPFAGLDAHYGGPIPKQLPEGLTYPVYGKPVKAAFSVLARELKSHAELCAHTRFSWRELWVIRRLVEPFERVARQRLPSTAGTAHRLLLEQPVHAAQFNLDGWVFKGQTHALGVVDAVMVPGTQAFMRWDHPSRLPAAAQTKALAVAQRFLAAVGFTQGLFNMEFFYDAATGKLTVIEFNPRLASQFGDLYRRVHGICPHEMTLAMALGQDPGRLARKAPTAGAAASLVYRALSPQSVPPVPSRAQQAAFKAQFPDGLLFCMPKQGHALARDFKWLGSHRYGIVHLGGKDAQDLRRRAEQASALLGWPAPFADDPLAEPAAQAPAAGAAQAGPSSSVPVPQLAPT